MAGETKIEWATDTWNPVRGCVKVSPGCKHCYAETFAERWRGVPGHAYEQGFDLRLVPDALQIPLRWSRPRLIFVNSMSDLFWEAVPRGYVDTVFEIMTRAKHHTFQVLTKRARVMRDYMSGYGGRVAPPPNVWLGVSVEDRKYGLPRIDELRAAPAAVRFLSIEPLLEDLGPLDLSGIDWVICGGESGAKARSMHPDWARRVRDECQRQGVPFHFKQWGGTNKKAAGRMLDGRTWDEWPKGYVPPAPRVGRLPVVGADP